MKNAQPFSAGHVSFRVYLVFAVALTPLALLLFRDYLGHAHGPARAAQVAGRLQAGEQRLAEHRFGPALREFEAAVRLDPANARAQYRVGWVHLIQGELVAAEQSFREAIRLDPQRPEFHAGLGECLRQRAPLPDVLERAEASFKQAIALNPNDAESLYRLGLIARDRGRWTEAELYLIAAVRKSPELGVAYYPLGQVSRRLGKEEQARGAFDLFRKYQQITSRLLELQTRVNDHPDDPQAHRRLAAHLDSMEMKAEAAREREKAAALEARRDPGSRG